MNENQNSALKPEGLERLNELWVAFDEIKGTLNDLGSVSGDTVASQTSQLDEKIEAFEPAVTMIGQIKAGKTALVNAMIGRPNFLPSDVNPWTSVVTSLHLNARNRPKDTRAMFRFFDEEEWDRLVSTGGRLGELAQRAGFEGEHDEIRKQVDGMREKSRARLGKRFELLLGTSHRYDILDSDLIDRYVCHGGWDESDGESGRFADITKIADLYLDLPGYPAGLCLRDTPGVNDTFMMREQITINAIRDSRLCIVVLSAHQALSTMDLALLRLIANVDARDVLLFVNRIDELDDPQSQIPEIEESFRKTLKKQRISDKIDIMFGSALWALNAHTGSLDNLPANSLDTLLKWGNSGSEFLPSLPNKNPVDLAWAASGVPAIHKWIADRIVDGPAKAMLKEVRDEYANIVNSVEMSERTFSVNFGAGQEAALNATEVESRIDAIEANAFESLEAANTKCRATLTEKLKRSQSMFAERAVEALTSHLELHPDSDTWEYDPSGLRMMLRSAYLTFGDNTRNATETVFSDTCRDIEGVYGELFASARQITINPPGTAQLVPPAVVGQTIALDLNMSWWKKWLGGFRRKASVSEKYHKLILSETDPIITELSDELAAAHARSNERALKAFLADQRSSIMDILSRTATPIPKGDLSDKARAIQTSRQLIDSLAA